MSKLADTYVCIYCGNDLEAEQTDTYQDGTLEISVKPCRTCLDESLQEGFAQGEGYEAERQERRRW